MSASTPSPSAHPEELPHTPEPPFLPSLLLAHASPFAVFGPNIVDEDGEPQAPLTADVVASDVAFNEVSEDEVSVEQFLPTTPEVHTIGRIGFNRKSVFLKVVIMHLYAARCMLTLTHHCLQLAHVIPVSAPAKFLRFLERVFGDEPNTLNRHSSRNIWLLDASMHHNIDKGLIKLIPTMEVLEKIEEFTRAISAVRVRLLERKYHVKIVDTGDGGYKIVPQSPEANDDIEANTPRRTKILPPALYPYLLVGIHCPQEFTITRQIVNVNTPLPSGLTSDIKKPFELPLKVPVDMLQTQANKSQQATTFPFLRGIAGKKKEFEIIDPLEYDKNRELKLGQDPCLVLANVGEFLHVTRVRLQQDGATFRMADIVVDKVHQEHLRFILDLFTDWKIDDERILNIEKTLEKQAKDKAGVTQSRKSGKAPSTHSYNTRSRTSEVAKELLANFRPGSGPGFAIDSHSRDRVSIRDGDPPSPTPSRVTQFP